MAASIGSAKYGTTKWCLHPTCVLDSLDVFADVSALAAHMKKHQPRGPPPRRCGEWYTATAASAAPAAPVAPAALAEDHEFASLAGTPLPSKLGTRRVGRKWTNRWTEAYLTAAHTIGGILSAENRWPARTSAPPSEVDQLAMDEGGASMVKKTAVRTAMTQSETVGGKRRSRYSIPESVVLEAKAAAVANNAAWWGVKGAVKFQVPKELRADGAELKRQLNAVTRDGVMPEGFRDAESDGGSAARRKQAVAGIASPCTKSRDPTSGSRW
eukprot:gene24950-9713_t